MKPLFAIVLCLLLVFSFAACGSEQKEKEDHIQQDIEIDQTQTPDEPVFKDVVLLDNDFATVTVTGIDPDNMWGYTLQVQVVNKSQQELSFTTENACVNDVMCDPLFLTDVSAGKEANEEMNFMADVGDITKIELDLKAYDPETFADIFVESCTFYPMGEAEAKPFVRTPVAGEQVVFDNENCTMIILSAGTDDWGYSVEVYLQNKTDKNLMFYLDDSEINSKELDGLWATEVAAGKQAFSSITWFAEDLEDNGIDTVNEICMDLEVSDADNWMAEDLLEIEYTYKP